MRTGEIAGFLFVCDRFGAGPLGVAMLILSEVLGPNGHAIVYAKDALSHLRIIAGPKG